MATLKSFHMLVTGMRHHLKIENGTLRKVADADDPPILKIITGSFGTRIRRRGFGWTRASSGERSSAQSLITKRKLMPSDKTPRFPSPKLVHPMILAVKLEGKGGIVSSTDPF